MPDSGFPSALVAVKNQLHQSDGWRWLVEVDVDGTNGFRLCDGDQPVTYTGNAYTPYPLSIDTIDVQGDGSLPEVAITAASVDDYIAVKLDGGYILDRELRLLRVNVSNTAVAFDCGRWRVLDAALDYQSATFFVGPYPLFDAEFPTLRQNRARCPKVYGGTDCQYLTTLPNLISGTYPSFDPASCDYGYATGNGCIAHGANEASNGAAKRHPGRFGGFPGIPKGLRL